VVINKPLSNAWQQKSAGLLKDEIENVLADVADSPSLCSLVREPLNKTKRALSDGNDDDQPWPLLPLMVSDAICDSYVQVLPAAAALQFLLAAGDVFDDIEDADATDSIYARYGLAEAVSVGSTLLILGEHSLAHLKARGVDADAVVRVMEMVNLYYAKACIGQHLDITTEVYPAESEEMYLKIIGMKSAAQVECACCVGATLAGAKKHFIDAFTLFGRNLGMASQISNDIQGLISGSDIIRRKMTLPVIYALNLPDIEIRKQLKLMFQEQNMSVQDSEILKKLFFQIGAIHYATIKMNVYKQKAIDIISSIEKVDLKRLKPFLD
jgi:competence protein ComQ